MSANNRAEQIFNQAVEMESASHRDAFLKGACGEDNELRQRVEKLIRAHEAAGGFLNVQTPEETPTVVSANLLTEGPGTVIDRYKLLEKLGEGGFGAVYVAEQREPVKRRVALKIIKLGMDTRQVVARFEAERQALALMDHPNIAKIYDAGVTDAPQLAPDVAAPPPSRQAGHPLPSSNEGRGQGEGSSLLSPPSVLATHYGRPYFVMELVRGIKITDYCDQNNLTTRERLDLSFRSAMPFSTHTKRESFIETSSHRTFWSRSMMVCRSRR